MDSGGLATLPPSPMEEFEIQHFPSPDILQKFRTFFKHLSSHLPFTGEISAEGKMTHYETLYLFGIFQVGQGYPHDAPKVKCETKVCLNVY